jgi:trimethylamine--corrinoid protein Co-methyltransferase
MLVMNDEIIAMTRRILRGIVVSDETLMLDLIDEVGPAGAFMSTYETAKQCRDEIWVPTLMDRQRWVNWEMLGRTTMRDRIRSRLNKILETHTPLPLPPGAEERIQAIIEAAEARMKSQ